jgi:hypothetical protein
MSKKHFIYIVLSVFLAFACKKIEPPIDESEANDPIYLLEGLMDGDSLSLYVNDTSVFISSSPTSINGIEGYSSSITDIENGLEVRMTVIRPERLIDADGAKLIEKGEFDFLYHQPTCKKISFSEGSNQGDYLEVDLDGAFVDGLDLQFKEYGNYVALMKFPNLSEQAFEIPISTGFDNLELNPGFSVTSLQNVLTFNSDVQNVNHEWYLNKEVINTNASFEHECLNGLHEVMHKLTDSYGNVSSEKTMIFLSNGSVRWVMSNEYCVPEMAASNFEKIIVNVVKDGETYTSAFSEENQFNNVSISDVIYAYNQNSGEVEFVKFRMDFDVLLKTLDNSKSLSLKEMKGVFNIRIN